MDTEIIDIYGTKRYLIHGAYHKLDGPPCIFIDGSVVICSNGTKRWLQNNKYHREDGPAVIWSDGPVEFWAHGIKYESLEELTIGVVINQ